MIKRSAPDWEAIERAYRAGAGSLRALAEAYGTKEGTIRSRAKAQGWQRDLTEQVRAATRQKISRTVSRSDRAEPDLREDAQVVADVSDKRAGVVVAQIGRLEELGEISGKLRQSLRETDIDADNQAEFSRSLNAAVDAELKLIKAERQAYGIDESNSEESYEDRLARLLVDQ
ncbi:MULTISPECIES: hypothetical protein [unclassified Pseudomonas]|uniref:hypothetical protein n=1 Tax=unclassified Pseudomonas TaxID=196821 RepID=UPI000D341C15|nr:MULTISPECIES: hypothetical protein [unclassified Pseudomonas]RAU43695.1 hypothetical protein DBP26_019400 [Pseudomonas sp. RIT 409]RAU54373.1 hypothetical protein DBY65_008570 [Pseudomonas sp. RIT 412]